MKSIKAMLGGVCCTILLACSATPPVHARLMLPENTVLWWQVEELDQAGNVRQSSLLSAQTLADGQTRWLQTDPLGAPQARLIATQNGWKSDGFAPPNRAAEQLFEQLAQTIHAASRPAAEAQEIEASGIRWRVRTINMP